MFPFESPDKRKSSTLCIEVTLKLWAGSSSQLFESRFHPLKLPFAVPATTKLSLAICRQFTPILRSFWSIIFSYLLAKSISQAFIFPSWLPEKSTRVSLYFVIANEVIWEPCAFGHSIKPLAVKTLMYCDFAFVYWSCTSTPMNTVFGQTSNDLTRVTLPPTATWSTIPTTLW